MKKLTVFAFLATALVFQFCSGSKKAHKAPVMTFNANVLPTIEASCSPCHIAGKGNKKTLNNYIAARDNIDDMIHRIQLNPEDKGFMPFKHPKLPDSTIQVFVKWKETGMTEK